MASPRSLWRLIELPTKLVADGVIVAVAFFAALALRFDGVVPEESVRWFWSAVPFIIALYLGVNLLFGIYRRWWRYAGLPDAIALAESVALSTAVFFVVDLVAFPSRDFPLSVVVIGGGIAMMLLGASKLRPRLRRRLFFPGSGPSTAARLMIVGAGKSGQMLAHELLQHREWAYRPVCFVDDDPKKSRLRIHGIPVLGDRHDIPALVDKQRIDVIAIDIPSATGATIREVVTICQMTNAKVQIVPGIPELMAGEGQAPLPREITVTDLLGRESVEIDVAACRRCVTGEVVLVTGAAGSIGQELCRQLLEMAPRLLVALDSNESGLFDLGISLGGAAADSVLRCGVVDITDAAKVDEVFSGYRPSLVFHAAGYKHVPLMEEHVDAAYRVNLLGTRTVLLSAERHGARRVTFVSTDKAVNPCNVMGATKRLGELLVMALGRNSKTSFCAVRFGNVLGSRGSVVPTFWQQIESGGPVTVTHPEVSRFFMSIQEAVRLMIQAATFARSGEIFLLDMGDEIKIVELAQKMVRMRGRRPNEEIEIVFTGLRPGEKLREELVGQGETLRPTDHARVKRVVSTCPWDRDALLAQIEGLGKTGVGVSRAGLFALLEPEGGLNPSIPAGGGEDDGSRNASGKGTLASGAEAREAAEEALGGEMTLRAADYRIGTRSLSGGEDGAMAAMSGGVAIE